MTKQEIVNHTRALLEETYSLDPHFWNEAIERITGSSVFVWSNLSANQLHALGRVGIMLRLSASDY
jgi:hypothetical protein